MMWNVWEGGFIVFVFLPVCFCYYYYYHYYNYDYIDFTYRHTEGWIEIRKGREMERDVRGVNK